VLNTFDDLNSTSLAELGFKRPDSALMHFRALTGGGIPDSLFNRLLPALIQSLAESPDPDRAIANFSAWLGRVGSRTTYCSSLVADPKALDDLLAIFARSQYMGDMLVRYPEYFEIIADPTMRDRPRSLESMEADALARVAIATSLAAKRDALRRYKPVEVIRIVVRDLLGLAPVEQSIAEISDFAHACVRAAVAAIGSPPGIAVIAMGKLGARELNYASDIDLIMVHADTVDQQKAVKHAEAICDMLATPTPAGFVFRVDLRLRPEGRFGSMSRSLSGCKSYYESWAEPWERQAMIKARAIAGDAEVGAQFLQIARSFAYRPLVTSDFVEEIQAGKRRLEQSICRARESDTNVKEGVGGIRDVEFTVQLLQLIAGGSNPALRVPDTLTALRKLTEAGLIASDEAQAMREGYLFLRNVEHRLQLIDEKPERNIPPVESDEGLLFARNLGFESAEAFLNRYRMITRRNHALFLKIFYGTDLMDAAENDEMAQAQVSDLLLGSDTDRAEAERRIAALGFHDAGEVVKSAIRSLRGTEYGGVPPKVAQAFERLLPRLLERAAKAGNPDAAYAALDLLLVDAASPSELYETLVEQPNLLDRLFTIADKSPHVWTILVQNPPFLDRLTDDRLLETASQCAVSPLAERNSENMAMFLQREQLRTALRDVLGQETPAQVMRDLTVVFDKLCKAALVAADANDLAIIGLGKLGGGEPGYASDLDLLFVGENGMDYAGCAEKAARVLKALTSDLALHGATLVADARLRPDGRIGALVRSVDDYSAYYADRSDTWERQALLKARFVAGPAHLGNAFIALARAQTYRRPPDDVQLAETRKIKKRMENERATGKLDIKLGPGGMSDIEWTAQILQWTHGARWTKAQTPGTLQALMALRDAAKLRQDDWETLDGAYRAFYTLRNAGWLEHGKYTHTSVLAPEIQQLRARVRDVYLRLVGQPG